LIARALVFWRASSHPRLKDFKSGSAFLQRVAVLAENEGHHPDLHLVSYNNVTVRLSTYALGGLSYNDFIMALKIDCFPQNLRP
jgi:4a-hydroxytetrahydrobiopterin dehydratase